ncbi:MAG: hypothetical protein ABIJ39_08135 [Chloroflexota bacterium]
MSLDTPQTKEVNRQVNPDRWKKVIILLTLINTVLVALIAALQTDASTRSSTASAESQYFAILLSSELLFQGMQGDYDLNTYAAVLINSQEALVLEYTALQRQVADDLTGYQSAISEAAAAQARSERAAEFSVFLSNPRYAPESEFDLPDMDAYMAARTVVTNALLEKQNAAADTYHIWNGKADSYVAVLTILAIAFFLLNIAQSTRPGLRLFFGTCALLVMGIASLWTLIILLE